MKYYFVQHRQRLTSLLIAMMRAADVRGASELLKSSLEYILATIDQSYGKPLIQQIVEEVKPETGGEIMTMAEWLRSEGASKEAHEIAARLLDLGIDSASIIKATNLSATEIEELKNKRVND